MSSTCGIANKGFNGYVKGCSLFQPFVCFDRKATVFPYWLYREYYRRE